VLDSPSGSTESVLDSVVLYPDLLGPASRLQDLQWDTSRGVNLCYFLTFAGILADEFLYRASLASLRVVFFSILLTVFTNLVWFDVTTFFSSKER
jgi:hypothetical protein